jgi:hypothetical protein
MKDKENLFKGRVFSIASAIGEGQITHPATVLESYGNLCLVRVRKAFTRGQFNELGIFTIGISGDNEEMLIPARIDFETKDGAPIRRQGADEETRAMFERMVSKMQLADSESELSKDRKIKESLQKEKADRLKAENNAFINARLSEITIELKEALKTNSVEKVLSDKKTKDLAFQLLLLEKVQTLLKSLR